MNKTKRQEIFLRLRSETPRPTTELNYASPFELLISVILSAQATDVSVNKATGPLFAAANTPHSIKALGLRKLRSYVKSIGLYNTKAANILKTCDILLSEHNSQVPEDRAALEALPGVGRKTANVVLNTAFGHTTGDIVVIDYDHEMGAVVGEPLLVYDADATESPGPALSIDWR